MHMAAMGFTDELTGHEHDPVMERDNPQLTDGAYFGTSRGHLFPAWARRIGMPRQRAEVISIVTLDDRRYD
jgi:hypothetical protein